MTDPKDLMRRIATPTSWKEGDRVKSSRGDGVVIRVEQGTGAVDGLQVVAWRHDDGTMVVSIGGELEPA